MNDIVDFVIIIGASVIVGMIGIGMGANRMEKIYQTKMVKAHVAHWEVKSDGDTKFVADLKDWPTDDK